jgi:hypothetical protein
MRIRLHITTPGGATRSFEHAGPVVRIGRDPAGELALQGNDGKSASWNHARIDLSPDGTRLTDLGSSNGTLLNDKLIEGPVPLRAGDRVQLGYTGATLKVLEIDLTAGPRPVSRRASLVAGAAAAGVVLAAAVAYLATRGSRPPASERAEIQPPPPTEPVRPIPPTSAPSRAPQTERKVEPPQRRDPPPPPPPPPPPEPVTNPLAGEIKPVGTFVALPQWGPAVLLQRQGEAYPWLPLRPEGKVSTGVTLVSLPGYRGTLALDGGVKLTLWGNLPEFSAFPPVLESAVMLNAAPAGFDLDLTLERGRVHLANTKPADAARVQIRFLREVWQLTLPEPGAEAAVELWTLPAGPATGPAPVLCLGLFTKGKARLQAGAKVLELADRSRVTWVHGSGAAPQVEVLPELPEWWTKPPDRGKPLVADALLTLSDWAGHLNRSTEVIDTLLTRVRESNDSTLRVVGLLFLAALDGAPFLVDFLEDRQHAEVRGTARHAVQAWLGRRPENGAELQRLLQEKRGLAREKAALVCKLLQPLPAYDLARAETYQELIGRLDHENLLVRDLAFWHLANLVEEGPRKIAYDPAQNAEQRRPAVEQWRKLVPPGVVPRAAPR